jgi:hypothetical protein
MKWEAVDSNVGEWKSWKSTLLETVQPTPLTSLYIYYTQFTFQAIFLKALLLIQTEDLGDCILHLTKHIIMKACVKSVDSTLHNYKGIPTMRFTYLFYTS